MNDKIDKVSLRLKQLYSAYEKERNSEDEDAIIDVSVACQLADSIPYLIKKIEELQKEKEYWNQSHNNHQKAIEALKEIAIYEGDFYGNDMALIAKKALKPFID